MPEYNPMPFSSMMGADQMTNPESVQAQQIAQQGRFGDTELVHMSMPEIAVIESEVGELPRNPVTGVKEAAFWLPFMAATAASQFMQGRAANAQANDQRDYDASVQRNAAANEAARQNQYASNRASQYPTYMRGWDIGVNQPAGIGQSLAISVSPEGQAIDAQLLAISQRAQQISNEVELWKQQNAEPPQTIMTKGSSGFFGLGGKAPQEIPNPKHVAWKAQERSYVGSRMNEIMSGQQTAMNLSYQRTMADQSAYQGISDQYTPMTTAARQQIGDVFNDELLGRELEHSDPVRAFRTKQAESVIQAQREGYENALNQQAAQEQARRGYGGGGLSEKLARASLAGGSGAAIASTRLGAEGQNIADIAASKLNNEQRKLNLGQLPFSQLGAELQKKAAPMQMAQAGARAGQGSTAPFNIGSGTYMPQPMPAFSNIPSPQAIGARGLSNLTDVWGNQFLEKGSGGDNPWFEGFAADRQAADTRAHERAMELIQEQNKGRQKNPWDIFRV